MNYTENFLDIIWPETGHFCLALKVKERAGFEHVHVTSPEEAAAVLKSRQDQGDWYYAVASFSHYDESIRRKGFRTAANVAALRVLYLDVDVGKNDKGASYETAQEAQSAINNFVNLAGLPQPLVVSSGKGFHLYWVLERDYPREEWLELATMLKVACVNAGFKADPVCTTDAARVLRPAGAIHTGTGNFVQVLDWGDTTCNDFNLRSRLEAAARGGNSKVPVPKPGKPGNYVAVDALTASLMPTTPPPDYEGAFEGCKQLQLMLKSGVEQSEPMWYAALQLSRFMKTGSRMEEYRLGHHISSRDPRYDADQTQAKLDQLDAKGIGPTLCTTFERNNPSGCVGCPNRGRVSTPLQLAQEYDEAKLAKEALNQVAVSEEVRKEFELPVLPDGFEFRSKEEGGGVVMSVSSAKIGASMIEVTPYWCFVREVLYERGSAELKSNVMWEDPQMGWQQATVSVAAFESAMGFSESALAKRGLMASPGVDKGHLMTFLAQCTRQMREQQGYLNPVSQMGWTREGTFVLGNVEYSAKQAPRRVPVSAAIESYVSLSEPQGTFETWKKLAAIYNYAPYYALHRIVAMAAPASILMRMTGITSGVLAFTGDGGGGKSSAARVGLQMFMSPRAFGGNNDTVNSTMTKFTAFKDLPVCMDEFGEKQGNFERNLDEFFKSLTMGRDKDRATFAGAEGMRNVHVDNELWHSLFVMASNPSIIDALRNRNEDTHASQSRVLELRVKEKPPYNEDIFTMLDKGVATQPHSGHAGPIFIQYVLDNYETVEASVVQARKDVAKYVLTALQERTGLVQTGFTRFMEAMAATIIIATTICKGLKLVDYDPKEAGNILVQTIIDQMTSTIQEKVARTDYLGNIYRANVGTFLVVENNQALNRWLVVKQPHMRYSGIIEIDSARGGEGELHLFSDPLREWCKKHGQSYREVLVEWRRLGIYNSSSDQAQRKRYRKMDFDGGAPQAIVNLEVQPRVFTLKLNKEISDEILSVERKGG